MINEIIKLTTSSDAYLAAYILQDEEYARKGTRKPAVIICPGGGYAFVSQNEGEPVALAFAAKGYHAFVLHYSVGIEHPFPCALIELAEALAFVRNRSDEWNIEKHDISVCGFSAGGHLATCLGIYYTQDFLTETVGARPETIRPDALILGYPSFSLRPARESNELPAEIAGMMEKGLMPDFGEYTIRQILTGNPHYQEAELAKIDLLKNVSSQMPPVFLFGSNRDTVIPSTDLLEMAGLLREKGVPYEMHLFERGPHGQGLYTPNCTDRSCTEGNHMEAWFPLALSWLSEKRIGESK
jgi:acetyl esterase/lipase